MDEGIELWLDVGLHINIRILYLIPLIPTDLYICVPRRLNLPTWTSSDRAHCTNHVLGSSAACRHLYTIMLSWWVGWWSKEARETLRWRAKMRETLGQRARTSEWKRKEGRRKGEKKGRRGGKEAVEVRVEQRARESVNKSEI